MCNYIAEALNKVFVKAKKIAILQPIKAEDSQQNVTNVCQFIKKLSIFRKILLPDKFSFVGCVKLLKT